MHHRRAVEQPQSIRAVVGSELPYHGGGVATTSWTRARRDDLPRRRYPKNIMQLFIATRGNWSIAAALPPARPTKPNATTEREFVRSSDFGFERSIPQHLMAPLMSGMSRDIGKLIPA